MVDRLAGLQRCVDGVRSLHNKLVLVVGHPDGGKTALAYALAISHETVRVNVGAELGARLMSVPRRQRAIEAGVLMQQLVAESTTEDLVVLDNIELLFDQSLKLEPLGVLRRIARSRCVVAVWPGELRHGRLRYAELGHPEYRDYGTGGVVSFDIETV